jgi:hypothetical protein
MIGNYFSNCITSKTENWEMLPFNEGYIKLISINIEGFPITEITSCDANLEKAINILTTHFKNIVDMFSEDFAFSQPELSYNPKSKIWKMTVGLGEKRKTKKESKTC